MRDEELLTVDDVCRIMAMSPKQAMRERQKLAKLRKIEFEQKISEEIRSEDNADTETKQSFTSTTH